MRPRPATATAPATAPSTAARGPRGVSLRGRRGLSRFFRRRCSARYFAGRFLVSSGWRRRAGIAFHDLGRPVGRAWTPAARAAAPRGTATPVMRILLAALACGGRCFGLDRVHGRRLGGLSVGGHARLRPILSEQAGKEAANEVAVTAAFGFEGQRQRRGRRLGRRGIALSRNTSFTAGPSVGRVSRVPTSISAAGVRLMSW